MNKVGRPLKFESVESLEAKIQEYFDSCWETKEVDGAILQRQVRPYTITGLAVHLDTSRETLLDYEDKEQFSDTIKRAKMKIHNYVEEYLFTGKNQTGAIFNLKNNYGWTDKTEVDNTHKGDGTNPVLVTFIGNDTTHSPNSD